MNQNELLVSLENGAHSVTLAVTLAEKTVYVDKNAHDLTVRSLNHTSCTINLDGTLYHAIVVRRQDSHGATGEMDLLVNGVIFRVKVDDHRTLLIKSLKKSLPHAAESFTVRAPMPGLVSRIEAKAGDLLNAGDGILILEAMKMENEIRSPSAGVVSEIRVREGSSVEKNEVLAIFSTSQQP